MAFRRLGDAIRGSSSNKRFNSQEVIITLKLASRRLIKQRKKLESKERESLKKLQSMATDGDRQRAKQYAQRIAEMRAMVRQIENSEMTIERIKFKLENVETTQMLGREMTNISKILTRINQAANVPDIATNIVNVEIELGKLEGVGEEISSAMEPMGDVEISGEANRILEEYMGSVGQTSISSSKEDPKIRSLREKLAKLEDKERV